MNYTYEEVKGEVFIFYDGDKDKYLNTRFTHRLDDQSVKKGVILKHYLNGDNLMLICAKANASSKEVINVISQYNVYNKTTA